MKPRNRFSERVQVLAPEPIEGAGAKQQFKDQCDINQIMRKFEKTGVITHVAKHEGYYGEVPATTYHEAMETVRIANEMFAEVPAAVRKKFGNDPEAFLAFVSDPENVKEMKNLGLLKPEIPKQKDAMEILGDRIEAAVAKTRNPPRREEPEDDSTVVP